jgi:protein phosphatase
MITTTTIAAALSTDPGCVRERNEDNGRIVRPQSSALGETRGILAIVADGMGGHASGEVASALAVDAVHRAYYEAGGEPSSALAEALQAANRAIFDEASRDQRLQGMGTTCVALAIRGDEAYAANVGDSRLYLIRSGGIYQMTTDDSAVAAMVAQGLLTREQARTHEERNVILRALGTREEVQVTVWEQPLPIRPGDVFLLCSDGLTDLVDEQELLRVASTQAPAQACEALVALARERGGFDNITVAVLHAALAEDRPAPVTRELRRPE